MNKNAQVPQSTNSFKWYLWGEEDEEELGHPYHSKERITGVQLAIEVFDFANSKRGKQIFISHLTKHTFAMRYSWYEIIIFYKYI